MLRLTKSSLVRIYNRLKINVDVVPYETLKKGIKVEWEHNGGKTNVIKGSITSAAKIALAHISEFPDYYERLEAMEEKAKKYWKNKTKKSVFV